jgi:hypothetical protein
MPYRRVFAGVLHESCTRMPGRTESFGAETDPSSRNADGYTAIKIWRPSTVVSETASAGRACGIRNSSIAVPGPVSNR